MRIAITGASGFLGSYVVEHLSQTNEVVALSRSVSNKIDQQGIEYKKTNYTFASLVTCLKGCDSLIHLAAQRPNIENDSLILNNVVIDGEVFRAAEYCNVKNIVFSSTRGVYGSSKAPWKEDQISPKTLYSLAKSHSEKTAQFYNLRGLNIKSLRLAQLFGLGEYEGSAVTTFIKSCYRGKDILLTADGINREYIYVKDVALAFETALNKPETSGVFNLGSGETVSLQDMADSISLAFGNKNIVTISDNVKHFNEYSLMDSQLFSHTFNWQAQYSFLKAAEDIAENLKEIDKVSKYGF